MGLDGPLGEEVRRRIQEDKARFDEEMKPWQEFLDTKVRHDDIKAEIAMGKYFTYLTAVYLEENYFRKPWFNPISPAIAGFF